MKKNVMQFYSINDQHQTLVCIRKFDTHKYILTQIIYTYMQLINKQNKGVSLNSETQHYKIICFKFRGKNFKFWDLMQNFIYNFGN